MLSCINSGSSLFGMETGRRFNRHCIQLAFEQFFVTIQARISPRRINTEFLATGIYLVLEIISTCHYIIAAMCLEKAGYPRTTRTTTNQSKRYFAVGFCTTRQVWSNHQA